MNQLKRLSIFLLLISLPGLSPSVKAQAVMFEGKPIFAEGADLGYYIWRDGDTWRMRWTTKGQMRRFSGSVVSEGGELKSLKRIDVETERRVLYPGRGPRVVYGPRGRARVGRGRAPVIVERNQDKIEKDGDNRIVFIARTNDDIDGFDFKVDKKVKSLRFVLEIDGQQLPQRVEIGKNNQKAQSLPLVVRLE
jgi:hypothetical protein